MTKAASGRYARPRSWYSVAVYLCELSYAFGKAGGRKGAAFNVTRWPERPPSLARQGRDRKHFVMCIPKACLACPGDPALNRPRTHDPCVSPSRVVHPPEFSALLGRASHYAACLSGEDQRQPWGSPTTIPISDLHRHGLSPSLASNIPTN